MSARPDSSWCVGLAVLSFPFLTIGESYQVIKVIQFCLRGLEANFDFVEGSSPVISCPVLAATERINVWPADLDDGFKSARPGSRWCLSTFNEDFLFGLVLLSVPWVGTFGRAVPVNKVIQPWSVENHGQRWVPREFSKNSLARDANCAISSVAAAWTTGLGVRLTADTSSRQCPRSRPCIIHLFGQKKKFALMIACSCI